jgi:hypothetical protein
MRYLLTVSALTLLAYCAATPARAANNDVVITQRTSTGQVPKTLADPNADRLIFWDDSASAPAYLTLGSGLSISGTTISASGGGGTWGSITGTLSAQTDLQSALDAKLSTSAAAAAYQPLDSDLTSLAALATTPFGRGVLELSAWPTFNQSTTGNAATATALQNARNINGTSFDGTGNITVTAAAGTLTGSTLASGVTDSSLTSVGALTRLQTGGGPSSGAPTTTDNPLSSSATTINVTSTTGFPTSGVLILDMYNRGDSKVEIVSYTGTTSTSFTGVTRGLFGSTAQSHVSGAYFGYLNFISAATGTKPFMQFYWNGAPYLMQGFADIVNLPTASGLTFGSTGDVVASGFRTTNGHYSATTGNSTYIRAPSAAQTINLGDNNAATINIALGGGSIATSKTITASGTTGAQTINKVSGAVNFAAAATTLVVTNSLVTANSVIVCTVATTDATLKSVAVVPATGSFTLHGNAAATAETRINFVVLN